MEPINLTDVEVLVDSLMYKGLKSNLGGWMLSDILQQVEQSFGSTGSVYAKHYIIHDKCGIHDEYEYIRTALCKMEKEKETKYKEAILTELTSSK
jgi:hypothetical protein